MDKDISLMQTVDILLKTHQGVRILPFEHQGQKYWLKQPEKLSLVWRLLKPDSKRALQKEQKVLQRLMQTKVSTAPLVVFDEHFLVLQDVGTTINQWLENQDVSLIRKARVLRDAAKGLADLHRLGVVHGRPALRDIAWQDGKICFIDWDNQPVTENLRQSMIRDSIIFLHAICRSRVLNNRQAKSAIRSYRNFCEPEIWQYTKNWIWKNRWIYYLLYPFKPIARMDLIAIYRLFELLRQLESEEK